MSSVQRDTVERLIANTPNPADLARVLESNRASTGLTAAQEREIVDTYTSCHNSSNLNGQQCVDYWPALNSVLTRTLGPKTTTAAPTSSSSGTYYDDAPTSNVDS